MASGYDATDPASIPSSVPSPDYALGYVDGDYPSFPAMVARFPSATHVRISAIPSTSPSSATVADGERGDYSPGQAANFARAKLASLIVPCIYCSLSEWDHYKQSCIDLSIPVSAVDWWIAAYPGNGPYLYPGSIGHQFIDRGTYDESVFIDGWQPGRPITSPVPPIQTGVADMQTQPFAWKPGQQDVLQVSFGTLWHKWNVAGKWYNEPIASASGGVSTARLTIPDQLPQYNIIAQQCVITIEDASKTVFYFAQSQNSGSWGVAQLP